MRFEVFQRRTLRGLRWFFRLRADNGQIVAASEAYHNYQDMIDTIHSIRGKAGTAEIKRVSH